MTGRVLEPALAQRAWAILVEECGADPDSLGYELFMADCARGFVEHRFGGMLGFGGKLYTDRASLQVDCYPEDRTPERAAMIAAANPRLAALDTARA